MEKYFAQILFVVGLVAWLGWAMTKRYVGRDLDSHEKGEAPADAQIRWHIWNIRKDISMLALTNFAILLVLVFALVLKF